MRCASGTGTAQSGKPPKLATCVSRFERPLSLATVRRSGPLALGLAIRDALETSIQRQQLRGAGERGRER
jgi:hypothetical protein